MEVEFVKERDYTNFASNSPPFWWKGELGSYPGHSIRTVQARPENWANELAAPPKFQSRAGTIPPAASYADKANKFVCCCFVVFFLFVELNGDPGCTNILYFKQRLSHSKIGLLEEHTRVKTAAPSPEGRGSYLSLSLLPSFLRKLFDFSHLYAKRLCTQRPIVSKYSRSVSNGFLCAVQLIIITTF